MGFDPIRRGCTWGSDEALLTGSPESIHRGCIEINWVIQYGPHHLGTHPKYQSVPY